METNTTPHKNLSRRDAARADRPSSARLPVLAFIRHYAEMVIAMLAGMILLEPVWQAAFTMFDAAPLMSQPEIAAFVMATNMTMAMAIWMRHRGHAFRPIVEMSAAMYLPFLAALLPYWTGAITGSDALMAGHVLMLPAMLVAMLLRPSEYTHNHVKVTTPTSR